LPLHRAFRVTPLGRQNVFSSSSSRRFKDDRYAGGPTDGSAWLTGGEQKYRVLRGGSWYDLAGFLRSADRYSWAAPDIRGGIFSFRLVAVART